MAWKLVSTEDDASVPDGLATLDGASRVIQDPATAGQLAQTVSGQQGQAPSTATRGTSTVVWNFASSVPSEATGAILQIAADQKWTVEEVSAAIRAAAGAPQTASITTQTNSSHGGNASSIPAGTDGAAGVGGAGTVQKP